MQGGNEILKHAYLKQVYCNEIIQKSVKSLNNAPKEETDAL